MTARLAFDLAGIHAPPGGHLYLASLPTFRGWRLLELTELARMPLNQITKDEAECTVFKRPVMNKKTRQTTMVPCSDHYTNQALRTPKRMQSKALEWKVLRAVPKITLAAAEGRDQTISEKTEEQIQQAYAEPTNHPRVRRLREQAWLVMVVMQDSGMRPDEVFSMEIENIHWGEHRLWIPRGKTKKGTALRGHERSHGGDAEKLVRLKDRGVGLSILPLEIRPPHHHCQRPSGSTRSGRLG
jgi:hypothetical protein